MIDSPLVRSAGRDVLSLALMDARNHSLHLFAQFQQALEGTGLKVAPHPHINPPPWHRRCRLAEEGRRHHAPPVFS